MQRSKRVVLCSERHAAFYERHPDYFMFAMDLIRRAATNAALKQKA
jgi:hypothetical protein